MLEQELFDEGPIPELPVSELEPPVEPIEPPSPIDSYSDEVQVALLSLLEDFEDEDRFVREKQIRKWTRNDCYWNNLQNVFWSDIAGDWVQPSRDDLNNLGLEGIEAEDFEKIINIYKAHGEAIIAALSVSTPAITFYPDDADEPQDISTAKGCAQIAELIQKHNKAGLLYIKALYHRWIEGTVFCYNYYRRDSNYGTTKQPQFQMVREQSMQMECTICGSPMYPEDQMCPECGNPGPPNQIPMEFDVPQLVGYTEEPKGREKLDIFGPRHIKIAQNCREQKDTPYLIMAFEQHFAMMKSLYPWIAEKIRPDYADKDYYDRFGRTGLQFFGDIPDNLIGVRCVWMRPWAFYAYKDLEVAKQLIELFPKGVYVVKVGEQLADIREEQLDDHWSISVDPFSSNLHAEPLGQTLIPVQDMTNELFRLTMETVEYGIPETFVDTEVLDLDKFEQQEVRPGNVTGAKSPAGQNLSAGFHTLHTATLSREIEPFAARLESAGQFLPGSFPSIYGGPAGSGSKTASEYAQSRAQALQRLGTYWKAMAYFWADCIARAVTEFVNNMLDDERQVKKQGTGFINVWIKKIDLQGKIGQVEPEVFEDLPMSVGQKRDLLLRLFELGVPEVNSVMFSPTNANLMKQVMGMPEMTIPGEEDRNKQLDEIQQLLQGEPLDEMGMQSSIPVDQEIENHMVESEVLRDWLVSEEGQYFKRINPPGYMNCVAHYREHNVIVQQRAMMAAIAQAGAPERRQENGSREQR